jgi:hypothetical protein
MREVRDSYNILVGKLGGKKPFWRYRFEGVKVWAGFNRFRTGFSGRLL